MPSVVACQKCAAKFKALDHLAGKTVKCPKCGGPVKVPALGGAAGGGAETFELNAPSSPGSFELPDPVQASQARPAPAPAAAAPVPAPAVGATPAEKIRKTLRILSHIAFAFVVACMLWIVLLAYTEFRGADKSSIPEIKKHFSILEEMISPLLFVVWVRIMVHAFRSSIKMGFLMLILPQIVLGIVGVVTMFAFAPWFANLVMVLLVAAFYGGFGFTIHRPAARSAATLIALMVLFMGLGIVQGLATIKSMRPSIGADGSVTFERVPMGPDGQTGKMTMTPPEPGSNKPKVVITPGTTDPAPPVANSKPMTESVAATPPGGDTTPKRGRVVINGVEYGPGSYGNGVNVTKNADGSTQVTFGSRSSDTASAPGPNVSGEKTYDDFSKPVAKVDPTIFAEPKDPVTDLMPQAGDDDLLGKEVGALGFRFRPPRGVKIDLFRNVNLNSSIAWSDAFREAAFITDPRVNLTGMSALHSIAVDIMPSAQQRPWIVSPKERVDQKDLHLYRIHSSNIRADFVRVSGVRFARTRYTSPQAPEGAPYGFITYFASLGDKALVITAMPAGDEAWLERVEAFVRSIRPLGITEEAASPVDDESQFLLAVKYPASRDAYRKAGRDLSADAVAHLKSKDRALRMASLSYLAETQPRSRRAEFAAAAADPDTMVAHHAARLLSDIAAKPDPLDAALAKLKSPDVQGHRWTVINEIAKITPDDRRELVTAELLPFLDSREYFEAKCASEALLKWGGDSAVDKMLKIINTHTEGSRDLSDQSVYKNAVFFLAARKDPRALPPLAGMIRNYDREAREQMIAFGPAAEKEALKLLRDDNYAVGMEALRILKAIGGKESLPTLRTLANNGRGSAMEEAKEAVNFINARLRAEKEKEQSKDAEHATR